MYTNTKLNSVITLTMGRVGVSYGRHCHGYGAWVIEERTGIRAMKEGGRE